MRHFWLILLLFLGSPAWSQTVVASVEPLAKVLRSLYGEKITVTTLMQGNQNPHQLALSPRQAMAVQQADLVVWLGADVEAPLAPLVARRKGRKNRYPPLSGGNPPLAACPGTTVRIFNVSSKAMASN